VLDIKSTKSNKCTKWHIFSRIKKININDTRFTAIVYMVMLSLSLFTMYCYYGVELDVADTNTKDPFSTDYYSRNLFDSNYYLNYRAYQNEDNKIQRPSEFYLSDTTVDRLVDNVDVDYYSAKLEEEDIKNSFDDSFKDAGNYILDSDGQQKYMTINTKTGYRISNYNFDESDINKIVDYNENSGSNKARAEFYRGLSRKLARKYRNLIVIRYDEKGDYKTLYTYGIEEAKFNNYFLQLESSKKLDEIYTVDPDQYEDFKDYKLEPIKDRIFVYAIPSDVNVSFYDETNSVSEVMYRYERQVYDTFLTMHFRICLAIIILTLLIPTRVLKKYRGLSAGLKLPMFILVIVSVVLYICFVDDVAKVYMLRETINGTILKGIIQSKLNVNIYRNIVNLANIIFWFFSYTVIFSYIVLTKRLLEYGPKRYFVENSIIYKTVSKYVRKTKIFIDNIFGIDMSKKYNRLWITGIVIVFVGAMVLSVTKYTEPVPWVISIVIFLLVMFNYIKLFSRQVKEVTEDYSKLLELTKSIADGDLEKDIENEDIGVYDEIKNQLVSIKDAYKKSVDDEIKSQQMKSELISNVSHDLKTPLTSIITYSDLLMNMNTSDEARKYIETIYKKSERLKVLIDDMFEISKAQTGNIKLELHKIDVVELMKQSIGELEDIFLKKNITVMTKYPSDKVILELDGEKTYRIFENLLVNMSKYAMPNTRAYIEIVNGQEDVTISFKNISETFIDFREDEIIERFIRGDKSRNTEGSGLGLSITKSYVELQKGSMEIVLDADLFKVNIRFKKNTENHM